MFKRKVYKTPSAPVTRSKRPGVMARIIDAVRPQPKPVELRNPVLLEMARGQPCLFRVPGICNRDRDTTVACHSNLGIHGKAGARKADDCYTAWGCSACHAWLDHGPAPAPVKRAAFMLAFGRMRALWHDIAFNPSFRPNVPKRERDAALWALEHIPPDTL